MANMVAKISVTASNLQIIFVMAINQLGLNQLDFWIFRQTSDVSKVILRELISTFIDKLMLVKPCCLRFEDIESFCK